MDMFMALIAVMVSWLYAHLRIHQAVYIQYVQLFVCWSYLNKEVFKKTLAMQLWTRQ